MLVAAHNAAEFPTDPLYLPVQVGHALATIDLRIQLDDTGDNISLLNRPYGELTALYWAWKNLDAKAIGLSHYRRYFRGSAAGPNGTRVLDSQEASALLERFDIVIAKPRNYVIETIESHYRHAHVGEDLDVTRRALQALSPDYLPAFEQVFAGRRLSLYNMFLMRRELFDDYAAWLFPLMDEVYRQIDTASRSAYQERAIGYLGERLLNVWVRQNTALHAVGFLPVVHTTPEPKVRKAVAMLGRNVRGGSRR